MKSTAPLEPGTKTPPSLSPAYRRGSGRAAKFSPELELLLACVGPTDPDRQAPRIPGAVHPDIDWDLLIDLADTHRLIPRLHRCVQTGVLSPPDEPRTRLTRLGQAHARWSLRLAGELRAVLGDLADHGIRALALK